MNKIHPSLFHGNLLGRHIYFFGELQMTRQICLNIILLRNLTRPLTLQGSRAEWKHYKLRMFLSEMTAGTEDYWYCSGRHLNILALVILGGRVQFLILVYLEQNRTYLRHFPYSNLLRFSEKWNVFYLRTFARYSIISIINYNIRDFNT